MKDIFISHNWGLDKQHRDNHIRCKLLADKLIKHGYSIWFDTYDMLGNIDDSIIKGINNSKIVLICLTEEYINKINNAVYKSSPNDNCYKEWNYSIFKQKIIIPIIMETDAINIFLKNEGVIQMYLNSVLFINFSKNLDNDIGLLCKTLNKYKIYNKDEVRLYSENISFNNLLHFVKTISPRNYKKRRRNCRLLEKCKLFSKCNNNNRIIKI